MIYAILVFSVKLTVEFTTWAMNFSLEERKENDFKIIKAVTGNTKTRTIRNLLFSQTLQAVRIDNQGAPLLGFTKSIDYIFFCETAQITSKNQFLQTVAISG